MSSKAIKYDQSGKTFDPAQPRQDYDDGMMFFHSHSVWEAMQKLEKFYQCKIYGVLEIDDIVENLRDWNAFYNDGSEDFICSIDDVSKQLWLDAMESAYDNIHGDYDGYNDHMEYIYEYVVANLSNEQ